MINQRKSQIRILAFAVCLIVIIGTFSGLASGQSLSPLVLGASDETSSEVSDGILGKSTTEEALDKKNAMARIGDSNATKNISARFPPRSNKDYVPTSPLIDDYAFVYFGNYPFDMTLYDIYGHNLAIRKRPRPAKEPSAAFLSNVHLKDLYNNVKTSTGNRVNEFSMFWIDYLESFKLEPRDIRVANFSIQPENPRGEIPQPEEFEEAVRITSVSFFPEYKRNEEQILWEESPTDRYYLPVSREDGLPENEKRSEPIIMADVMADLGRNINDYVGKEGVFRIATQQYNISGYYSKDRDMHIYFNWEDLQAEIELVGATGEANLDPKKILLHSTNTLIHPETITHKWTLTGPTLEKPLTGETQRQLNSAFSTLTVGKYTIHYEVTGNSGFESLLTVSDEKNFELTMPPMPDISDADRLKGVIAPQGGFVRDGAYYNPENLSLAYTMNTEYFQDPVDSTVTLLNLETDESTVLVQNEVLPEQGRIYTLQDKPAIYKPGKYLAMLTVETTDLWGRTFNDTVVTEFTILPLEPTAEIDRSLNPTLATLHPVFSPSDPASYQWFIYTHENILVKTGQGSSIGVDVFGNLSAEMEQKTAYSLEFKEVITNDIVVTTPRINFSLKKPKPTFAFADDIDTNPHQLTLTRDSDLAALGQEYSLDWRITSQEDDITLVSGSDGPLETADFPTTPGLYYAKITETFTPYTDQANALGTVVAPFEIKAMYGDLTIHLTAKQVWTPHGDTFATIRLQNAQTNAVHYETVALSTDTHHVADLPASEWSGTATIKHLPVGTYKVSVLATNRYLLLSQSAPTVDVIGNTATAFSAIIEQKNYSMFSDTKEHQISFRIS